MYIPIFLHFHFCEQYAHACAYKHSPSKSKIRSANKGRKLRKESYLHQKVAFKNPRMRYSCLNGVPSCKAKSARRLPLRQWRHRLYRLVGVINFPFINAVFVTFVASSVGGLLLGPVKRFSRIPLAF